MRLPHLLEVPRIDEHHDLEGFDPQAFEKLADELAAGMEGLEFPEWDTLPPPPELAAVELPGYPDEHQMARIERNDLEREDDRAFLLNLARQAGPKFTAVEGWKLLNERRSARAREQALARGVSASEADAAAEAARLSVQTVRGDMRVVWNDLRQGSLANGAAFLDEQLASIQEEISWTYQMDEMILEDLARSRVVRKSVTRGSAANGGPPQPTQILSYRQDEAAGRAELWGRVQENAKLRLKLRAEQRMVKFGRDMLPAAEGDETFAQLLTKLQDPAQAQEAVLGLLGREIALLDRADHLPVTSEVAALDRIRAQRVQQKANQIREYLRLPGAVVEEGKARSMEVVFLEAEFTPRENGEENAE